MKILSISLGILLGILSSQSIADTQSVSSVLETRFVDSEFRLVAKQSDLPAMLVENFSGFDRDEIADVGDPYNWSDLIDPELPARQMVLAGISDSVSFLVFNQGGFATSRRTLLIGDVSGTIQLCEYIFGAPAITDFDGLRTHLERGDSVLEVVCRSAA